MLFVEMFGGFSVHTEHNRITAENSRSQKVWLLLIYLLLHRQQTFSSQALMDLFWPDSTGPENALRITLHRLRSLLNTLSPDLGQEAILRTTAGYRWNPQIPVQIDVERFDQLLDADSNDRLTALLDALSLYQGELLPKFSSELWVIPLAAHYQNRYLLATQEAVSLLSKSGRHDQAVKLCKNAALSEPYHEPLHQLLMQELIAMGDAAGAAAVYDSLSTRLNADFHIHPSEATRAVYRASIRNLEPVHLSLEEILPRLQENASENGAMICDYDDFRLLCRARLRNAKPTDAAAHIVLLSLTGVSGEPIAQPLLDWHMHRFCKTVQMDLHRSDVISRCSASQLILLLPNTNYENSCMVSRRVIAAHHRSHPHSPVSINFIVQMLSPDLSVP